jgi:hypothetical protein
MIWNDSFFIACFFIILQELLELARALERNQIITATNVLFINKDVGNSTLTSLFIKILLNISAIVYISTKCLVFTTDIPVFLLYFTIFIKLDTKEFNTECFQNILCFLTVS